MTAKVFTESQKGRDCAHPGAAPPLRPPPARPHPAAPVPQPARSHARAVGPAAACPAPTHPPSRPLCRDVLLCGRAQAAQAFAPRAGPGITCRSGGGGGGDSAAAARFFLRGRLDTPDVMKQTSARPPCPMENASDCAALGRAAHGRSRAAPLLTLLVREELSEGGRGRGEGGRAVAAAERAEEEAAEEATEGAGLGCIDACPDMGGAGHGRAGADAAEADLVGGIGSTGATVCCEGGAACVLTAAAWAATGISRPALRSCSSRFRKSTSFSAFGGA